MVRIENSVGKCLQMPVPLRPKLIIYGLWNPFYQPLTTRIPTGKLSSSFSNAILSSRSIFRNAAILKQKMIKRSRVIIFLLFFTLAGFTRRIRLRWINVYLFFFWIIWYLSYNNTTLYTAALTRRMCNIYKEKNELLLSTKYVDTYPYYGRIHNEYVD